MLQITYFKPQNQNDKFINSDKIIKIITAFTEITKLCYAPFFLQEKS